LSDSKIVEARTLSPRLSDFVNDRAREVFGFAGEVRLGVVGIKCPILDKCV